MRRCRRSSLKGGPITLPRSKTTNPPWQLPPKPCFRKAFPPQVVTIEDNRSREERRAIATRPVTPEQMGLAGTQQLALVQRTATRPAFVGDNLSNAAALAAKLASPADELSKSLRAA